MFDPTTNNNNSSARNSIRGFGGNKPKSPMLHAPGSLEYDMALAFLRTSDEQLGGRRIPTPAELYSSEQTLITPPNDAAQVDFLYANTVLNNVYPSALDSKNILGLSPPEVASPPKRQTPISPSIANQSALLIPIPTPAVLRRQSFRNSFLGKNLGASDQQKKTVAFADPERPKENSTPGTANLNYLLKAHAGAEAANPFSYVTVFGADDEEDLDRSGMKKKSAKEHSKTDTSSGGFPTGALFFLLGFIIMPFWWLGAFYKVRTGPKDATLNSRLEKGEAEEKDWRLMNRWMTFLSAFILIGFFGIIIWWEHLSRRGY